MSLVIKLLDIIEQQAKQQHVQEIKQITVEMGSLVAVDKQAFSYCFTLAKQRSMAANSSLTIIDVMAKAECMTCCQVFSLLNRYTQCPHCGDYAYNIIEGDQLRLLEMEVN